MAGATPPLETAGERAAAVQQVLNATVGEAPDVKAAAMKVLQPPVPPPTRTAGDIVWIVLVFGLVVVLLLTILGLTHVFGHKIADDKIITVFTTTLAGLLGLFVKTPGS